MTSKLRRIVENPYLNLFVGILFLLSGLSEAWETLRDDIFNLHFRGSHGIIIFSIMHVMKTIPDFFEGLEYVQRDLGK